MGRLVEGLWDCQHCGSKGIKGSIRECPNCAHPRDDSVKFYMPGTITYVSEEKDQTINKNPDWLCDYCNTLNSDDDTTCKSCGANRTEENLNYFENQVKKKKKKIHTVHMIQIMKMIMKKIHHIIILLLHITQIIILQLLYHKVK